MSARTDIDTPEVWVGRLGCYNDGRLVGRWVDGIEAGDVTVESLHASSDFGETVTDPYASTHEELWCMDYQGYAGLLDGECSPAEAQRIAEMFEAIAEDSHDPAAVAAWADWTGARLEEWDRPTREEFGDSFNGEWASEQEFAEQLAEDIGVIDESASWPNDCIDWERATRELFMDYYSASSPNGVYVFRR